MCGIAGWVDFTGDLTGERAVASAMTETMVLRGPDSAGVWLAPHAALGHRRLAVIDVEGGLQPMTAEESAVLTYSGEVYNFRELRTQLEAKGHRFRTRSDTEVVLRGYLEWGEDVVDRLNGIYAFALWDIRREELLLVRDRMGVKPLFHYPLPGGGLLFGSEPKAILAHPQARRTVDADGLREIFTIAQTPGLSLYKGMHEVRPGEVVRVRRTGLTKRRYWKLEAREHTDDLDTTVRTVRGLLDDIVERQLVSDRPLCSLLSGGLDSSALTALALQHGDIRSFAVDFAGYAEHFTPDEMRGSPDGPFVQDAVRHLNPDHTDTLLDTAELTDPRLRADVMRAWEYPQFSGDMNTSLYMLFRAIQGHSTVALSGESADEVFGGYAWFHLPRAVQAPTFPWLVVMMQKQRPDDLFSPQLREQLDVTAYEKDRYQEALAEVPHVPRASARERRMREISYLHLSRFVNMLLDRKDRLSMAHGLEVRVPFCDHRLVEYVFNTPWAFKTFDGREKSLLRAAVSDLLPASILERRKSPYPATQDPGYGKALRGTLSELVAGGTAPVLPLLDTDAVQRLLATPAEDSASTVTRLSMEMVLDLNAWLQSQALDVEV
ncbi:MULTISPECIES: asparagine synthase (glutamine-hydrolyzing) [Streptomyces]|uniref:asparagine synthase (glutamine-hydrolyzing) n=1 Tax=Streptomyces lycii TaxID=2654337 RepID=A0ABQ7FNH5_9ACTN|nr:MULTISPECIES: asparagine synthase (glutamine-hydrolyzing) [Streptomyces]KAF4409326.1 asparagine synthase (glutamine-hydrolyzing) [Streptomyces lycii]PGH47023.1 asparagine synthase (glutamine-hydrolyzing) [Streptomyces sp. Ru87]